MTRKALLAIEDGTFFFGTSIGVAGRAVGEVVFNTAITGYQEILTDPSYCRQLVTLTYPHIGNVGANDDDAESNSVVASGLIIRDLPVQQSNWRSELSLSAYLQHHRVVAIADIDTRKLTRLIREKGALSGCIVTEGLLDEAAAVRAAKAFPGLKGADLAREVSTAAPYLWRQGAWDEDGRGYREPGADAAFHVIAYDFGIKRNILRMLAERGCRVSVVPAETSARQVLAERPDGVFLSNGPGDPEPCDYAIEAIRRIVASGTPVFGICLGHQLLALACGGRTVKMKVGHHGANHPVLDHATRRVMITSQNHGFAVERDLPACLRLTHTSLFDGSVQGFHHTEHPAFGFQGHPEASPGPHDIRSLFDHFIDLMVAHKP